MTTPQPRKPGMQPTSEVGRPARILVLDDDWRQKMLAFMQTLGIEYRIRAARWEQPAETTRLCDNGTFWRDGALWLDPDPANGPLEWFYFIAQYGLARPDERQLFDFGVFGRNGADLLDREHKAKQVTIAWAFQSGMTIESLSRTMWDWRMTMLSQPLCAIPGDKVWNMKHHVSQCRDVVQECSRRLMAWRMPEAPVIWHTEDFNFARNAVVKGGASV